MQLTKGWRSLLKSNFTVGDGLTDCASRWIECYCDRKTPDAFGTLRVRTHGQI